VLRSSIDRLMRRAARAARPVVVGLGIGMGLAALPLVAASPARADIAAWIVIDAETGAVLDQQQARRQWYPASITKLMTAYLAFKAVREGRATLQSAVTISANAHAEPPSKMGFKPGTRITLDSALKMVIVKSANDVAVALAEAIAGSEPAFIAMMNAEAARLGMTGTRFVNPHGLPDNRQVSTARDLAVLARAVWQEFPQYRAYFNLPGIRVGKKALRSANREFLLRVPGANGMKTGYICNSGLNVAVSATRRGRTVIAVILGAASGVERAAKARTLIEAGFKTRRGRSVDQLAGVDGGPPADRYCKRNPRPTAEELMEQFAAKPKRAPVLSFSRAEDDNSRIRGGLALMPAASGGTEVPKKADGKTDWAKVMDTVIGPRRMAYEPIEVSLRTPSTAPRVATAGPVAVPGAPIPRLKPLGAAASSLVPATSAAAAPQPPKPGAIFQGQPLVLVPVPRASPGD